MFRVIIAKICFAFCFCFHAYATLDNDIVFNGYKIRLAENIDQYQIFDEAIAYTISKYLPYALLMMMASSILTIFSNSALLKLICLMGYLGFLTLNQSPQNRFGLQLQTLQQSICIVGGMLCLMGLDKKYVSKVHLTERELDELVEKKYTY